MRNKKDSKKEIFYELNFNKNDKTKLGIIEVIFLLTVIFIIGILIGFLIGSKKEINKTLTKEDNNKLDNFTKTYKYILDNYYGDINEDELFNAALEGMLSKLGDSNTTYIDSESSNNFNITLEGSYIGLGIEITNDVETGNIKIVSIFKDSPADKYGLLVGDILLKIDDKDMKGEKTSVFSKYVREKEDKSFELLISRNGEEKTIKIDKDNVVLKSVVYNLIEKNNKKIGYIYLSIFANNTYEQFKEALEDLESKNIDSLIIDVRSNSGGHMVTAKKILELFLDNNYILYQTEGKEGIEKIYSNGNITKTYKIVLLGNELSASSSEILISGLKDNLNAIYVGEKTYGKGTVQELRTLPDGSEYKFTTKKWLTPNGICIDKIGITPDYIVSLDDNYINNPTDENDNQLNKAIELLQ